MMWSFFGNKIYVLRKIMVISITQKCKQCNNWTNTWQHWNGHLLNDRVIKNCKKSTGLKIGKITRCYDIFMPKYDFEHYGSTENPWSLSIYFYFRSYFYYYSTCSLLLAIFLADEFSVFSTLHSFTLLFHFVCQAICSTYLFIFL